MLSESQVRARMARSGRLPRIYFLFLSDFFLSLGGYVLAASLLEQQFDLYWLSVNEHAWSFLTLVILAMQFSLLVQGHYSQPLPRSRISFLLSLAQSLGASLLMAAVLGYLLPGWRLPLPVMALGVGLNLAVLSGWRLLFTAIFWSVPEFFRVLFVGTGAAIRELAAHMAARPELKFAVLGFLEEPEQRPAEIPAEKILGPPTSLADQVASLRPDSVVIGLEESRGRLPLRSLLALRSAGVAIEEASALYEAVFGSVWIAGLRPHDLIFRRDFGARPGGIALQSIYVNLAALAGIVVLSPLLLVIALAIKLTSRGPVLEKTTCLGYDGLPFSRWRFRTEVVWRRPGGTGEEFERRPTRLGRWLVRLHLRRLPEIFNVLRGEMSLVGPQPHRAEFAEELARICPYYPLRQVVKPGVTGWAQINLKGSPAPADEMVALGYDLYYLKHLSPALDAYILLHSLI
jgi:lipopolysaccharide/colanic/teichoic acid biosynthesis glycosyltransferase